MADFTWPVVVNGKTYTAEMFSPYGYSEALADLMGNFATQAASDQAVVARGQAEAFAALAAMKAAEAGEAGAARATEVLNAAQIPVVAAQAQQASQQAQAAVAQVTAGSTNSLAYPEVVKNLVTASDVVAVAVYDTRLDRDGGAWTERRMDASWAVETLGSAVRGVKRTFPKVAIITLRSGATNSLVIWDALDLDANGVPRMWRIYPTASGGVLDGTPRCVAVREGVIHIGTSLGLYSFNFAKDEVRHRDTNGTRTRYGCGATGAPWSPYVAAGALSGADVASIAVRTLPGAPLDPATGLPLPILAVANNVGLNIIHPNGHIATISGVYSRVAWQRDNTLWASVNNSSDVDMGAIPYANASPSSWRRMLYATITGSLPRGPMGVVNALAAGAIGGNVGLTHLMEDEGNPGNGMVASANTLFSTGWQPTGIVGAWMGESFTGAVTAGEIVVNGNFDTGDLTGWLTDASSVGMTPTVSGGVCQIPASSDTVRGVIDQALATVPGQAYMLTYTQNAVMIWARVGEGRSLANRASSRSATAGTKTIYFTAVGTTTWLRFMNDSAAATTATVDNVSITPIIYNRSWRDLSFNVVGSLTAAPVASGADIAAYSGWGSDNYLEMPYNSALDFGTGDFCVALWANFPVSATGNNRFLIERADVASPRGSDDWWISNVLSTNSLTFVAGSGASCAGTYTPGTWTHIVALRRAGVAELWLNGVLVGSVASANNLNNASAILRLGRHIGSGFSLASTSLAMLRIAASAPTPIQIARMYRDERALFEAGAKALLGGNDNVVAALSRSEADGSLAVATADGVSIYNGLRRTEYLDSTTLAGAIANDTMRAVANEGGVLALGSVANAGARRSAITGLDRMPAQRGGPQPPARSLGVVVVADATPADLGPRIYVAEGEVVTVESIITAKQYGASATQVQSYVLTGTFRRDPGGNVTQLGTTTKTVVQEVTSTGDADFAVDTTAQTVTERFTGVAGTRMIVQSQRRIRRVTLTGELLAEEVA